MHTDEQRMIRVARAAALVALTLIGVKLAAWLLTDSVAILSTLVDSSLDMLASLMNLLAIRQALEPADREHRFGHGKAEPLAGLAQSAFITGSAVFLLYQAVARLLEPQPLERTGFGIGVMLFSIVLTLLLVSWQRRVARDTGSVAVAADALHYVSDVLVNLSVILALILSHWLGWHLADPVFALGVGFYVLYCARGIFLQSLDQLMDREMPDADRDRIMQLATGHPGVAGAHELRTRIAGRDEFIQLHLEIDGNLTLNKAHQIAVEVEQRIRAAYPSAEVLIHEDPAGLTEGRQRRD